MNNKNLIDTLSSKIDGKRPSAHDGLGEALSHTQHLARSLSLAIRSAPFSNELDAQSLRDLAQELDNAASKSVALFEKEGTGGGHGL